MVEGSRASLRSAPAVDKQLVCNDWARSELERGRLAGREGKFGGSRWALVTVGCLWFPCHGLSAGLARFGFLEIFLGAWGWPYRYQRAFGCKSRKHHPSSTVQSDARPLNFLAVCMHIVR